MKKEIKDELNLYGLKVVKYLEDNPLDYPGIGEMTSMFDYASRPGHKLRAGLVFLGCDSVGACSDTIIPAAAAVELFHKSTLLHDDIVDNDYYRRGLPAFHSKYGRDMGIVFGDFVCACAFEYIRKLEKDFEEEKVVKCFESLASVFRDVYLGQLQDLQFEERDDISVDEYMMMAGNKTGRLINGALEIGAVLGGGTEQEIKALSDFGYNFGVAFQIRNDVNNLTIEKELRKNGGSDIRARKRTLMVIHTLNNPDKDKLLKIFHKEEISDSDVEYVIDMFSKNGSINQAKDVIIDYANRAKMSVVPLKPTKSKKFLLSLVDYIGTDTYWKTHSKNGAN